MSTSDTNPKILKKQITCVSNSGKYEITEENMINGLNNFNRTNSLCTDQAESVLHKNASESSHLASLDSGHLHRSHELENLNLTDKQLQDLIERDDCLIMTNPKKTAHLQRTRELENLNEIGTDD